jgi:predicted lipoprotein
MKTIDIMAVAAAIAFSAASFTATPAAAKAAKAESGTHPEHYCLSYEAGADCNFTSYAQCEATAAGIGGGCVEQRTGDGARDHPAHR